MLWKRKRFQTFSVMPRNEWKFPETKSDLKAYHGRHRNRRAGKADDQSEEATYASTARSASESTRKGERREKAERGNEKERQAPKGTAKAGAGGRIG